MSDIELSHISSEELKDYLAEYALEGIWEKVVEMYNLFPASHTTKIDDSVGTALHVAVDLDEEEVVRDLIHAIITVESTQRPKIRALEMVNGRGDTPLHVAASRGFAKICRCIAGMNNERMYLLSRKNKRGETPLFLAAINWQKQAFAYLSEIYRNNVTLQDLVRNNGDTILHSAIRREYFDLAVIIVHYYDFLSTHANKKEATPLKVLATRPSAFKSTSRLSWWKRILYHCIIVEPLDPERAMKRNLRKMERSRDSDREMNFPENYTVLYDFFKFISKSFTIIASFGENVSRRYQHDTKNQNKSTSGDHEFTLSEKYPLGLLPPNYATFQQFLRSAYVHAVGLSGVALKVVKKTKKKHQWSGQLLKALMERPYAAFTGSGGRPTDREVEADLFNVYNQLKQLGEVSSSQSSKEKELQVDETEEASNRDDKDKKIKPPLKKEIDKKETAFLVAARNGIVEMVTEILSRIPSAIHNTNSKKENVLLVAVMNRQPLVVETLKMRLMQSKPELWNNLILGVDNDENTMLHLAAHTLADEKPWQIAGSALQMMWDIKWFQYVKSLVPQHFYYRSNRSSKSAREIFLENHKVLIEESSMWLKDTSQSCSVVAALIASVCFATASSIPGGNNEQGEPRLEGKSAFDVFAIATLIGLCFSVYGLIMFLTVLTSRKQASDFGRNLPLSLLLGLSSMFVSITAMLISFCTAHFYLLDLKFRSILLPVYGVSCLPATLYGIAQFPLYFDLLKAILTKVPRASGESQRL